MPRPQWILEGFLLTVGAGMRQIIWGITTWATCCAQTNTGTRHFARQSFWRRDTGCCLFFSKWCCLCNFHCWNERSRRWMAHSKGPCTAGFPRSPAWKNLARRLSQGFSASNLSAILVRRQKMVGRSTRRIWWHAKWMLRFVPNWLPFEHADVRVSTLRPGSSCECRSAVSPWVVARSDKILDAILFCGDSVTPHENPHWSDFRVGACQCIFCFGFAWCQARVVCSWVSCKCFWLFWVHTLSLPVFCDVPICKSCLFHDVACRFRLKKRSHYAYLLCNNFGLVCVRSDVRHSRGIHVRIFVSNALPLDGCKERIIFPKGGIFSGRFVPFFVWILSRSPNQKKQSDNSTSTTWFTKTINPETIHL